MKIKTFLVKISDCETFAYEESLVDGLINKNHLMYLAAAALKKRKAAVDPTRAAYEYYLIERDTETYESTKTLI